MADYIITRSDGVTEHTVVEQLIDTTYTSPLIGQGVFSYGQTTAQDVLRSLENHAFTEPPAGAILGQLWFDTNNNDLKYYEGGDPGVDDSTDAALWSSVSGVSADGITDDLLPKTGFDDVSLGSSTRRFHSVFAVHGNFSTQNHGTTDAIPALTINGDSVYSSSSTLQPELSATSTIGADLGLIDKRWKTVFTRDVSVSNQLSFDNNTNTNTAKLFVDTVTPDTLLGEGISGGTVTLGNSGQPFSLWADSITATSVAINPGGIRSSLTPDINVTHSIGAFPGQQFLNIYAAEFVENGIPLSLKYGGTPVIDMDEIQDVDITNLQDGQFLAYNNINSTWENVTFSLTGSHSALSDLGNDDHPQYLNETRADIIYDRQDEYAILHQRIFAELPPLTLDNYGFGLIDGGATALLDDGHFALTTKRNIPGVDPDATFFSLQAWDNGFGNLIADRLLVAHDASGALFYDSGAVIGGAILTDDIWCLGGSGTIFDTAGSVFADAVYLQGAISAVRYYDNDDPDSAPNKRYTTEAGGDIFVVRALDENWSTAGVPNTGEMIVCRHPNSGSPAGVQLYHDGLERMRTVVDGIKVLSGSGAVNGTIESNTLNLIGGGAQLRFYDNNDAGSGLVNNRVMICDSGVSTQGANLTFRGLGDDFATFYSTQLEVRHTNHASPFCSMAWGGADKLYTANNGIDVVGTVTLVSDGRLKENIVPIIGALESIKQLNGVRYNFTDAANKQYGLSTETELGLIAQDVEKVYPEAVFERAARREGDESHKTLSYEKLVPVLVEALKEATTRIEALETKVAKLSKK